jgi:hypothetical protein
MPTIQSIILGAVFSLAAVCCFAKGTISKMDRPAYVDEEYWNERSRRQPQNMAAAWRRSAVNPTATQNSDTAARVLNHSWGAQTSSVRGIPQTVSGVGSGTHGRLMGHSLYSV